MQELADWVPPLETATLNLLRRCWPGPVSLRFPDLGASSLFGRLRPEVRSLLRHERGVLFQCPHSSFVLDVLKLLVAPPMLHPLSPGEGVADDLDALAESAGCRLVVESPRTDTNAPISIVQVDSHGPKIIRAGVLEESTLARWTATLIVFICTGNILAI